MKRQAAVTLRSVLFLALFTLVLVTLAQAPSPVEANAVEANKAFIRDYVAAISGHEKPREMLLNYISELDDALIAHILEFEAAFPRYEFIEEDMVAEGDRVAVRFTFRGRHEGEFFGVAPTGRQAEIQGIIIYRLEGGRIVEHWLVADAMSLMQQLTEE